MDDLSQTYQIRLGELRADAPEHFRAGDTVRVRSAVEILATLDMEGRTGGHAILPEMVAMIGMTARVRRHRPKGTVQLDDLPGLWSEAWLAHRESDTTPSPAVELMARQRLLALATYNAAVAMMSAATFHIPTPVEMSRMFISLGNRFASHLTGSVTGSVSGSASGRTPPAK